MTRLGKYQENIAKKVLAVTDNQGELGSDTDNSNTDTELKKNFSTPIKLKYNAKSLDLSEEKGIELLSNKKNNHYQNTSIISNRVKHIKEFSLYNKHRLNINDEVSKIKTGDLSPDSSNKKLNLLKKKLKYGRIKNLSRKLSIYDSKNSIGFENLYSEKITDNFNNIFDPTDNMKTLSNRQSEYQKINLKEKDDFQLIKNYLIAPNFRNSDENEDKIIKTKNGKIDLKNLLSKQEIEKYNLNQNGKYKLELIHTADGQTVYSLVKNSKVSYSYKKEASLMKKIQLADTFNTLNRTPIEILPDLHMKKSYDIDKYDAQIDYFKEDLKYCRKKNLEKIKESKKKEKIEFAKFVAQNKSKLNVIDCEIKKILSKASLDYEKIDNKKMKSVYFP
jgi:hypothetical protein